MTTPDLPPIERISAVSLEPGDVLFVTIPDDATPNQLRTIKEALGERFPDQTVLVMTSNVNVDVVRRMEVHDYAGTDTCQTHQSQDCPRLSITYPHPHHETPRET